MSETLRIGEILVTHGVLTEQQVFEVVQAQKSRRLPFGVLAERMFDVTVAAIEDAWVEQYRRLTGTFSLAGVTPSDEALAKINRRQAWQFEMLPVEVDEAGDVLIAASSRRLARAVTFAAQHLDQVAYFRVADDAELRDALRRVYPMPEVAGEYLELARDMAYDTSEDLDVPPIPGAAEPPAAA
ncbi:MAG: hypothetical protein AAF078_05190 [Planctomycetota bacterium]